MRDGFSTKQSVQDIAYGAMNAVFDWIDDVQIERELSPDEVALVSELGNKLREVIHEWTKGFRNDD